LAREAMSANDGMVTEVTAPDGVVYVREAVLRPNPDQRRPLTVLSWQEGERALPAVVDGANASNVAKATQ
jgi:hypothetical protein